MVRIFTVKKQTLAGLGLFQPRICVFACTVTMEKEIKLLSFSLYKLELSRQIFQQNDDPEKKLKGFAF